MDKQKLIEFLRAEGFNKNVIRAFSKIKREDFISSDFKKHAYNNEPLPIGVGATISQPYTIAFMLELLELKNNLKILDKGIKMKILEKGIKMKILEIGSGSGYVLDLVNEICKDSLIYGIEINKKLVIKSKEILKEKKNIKIVYGDGSEGLTKFGKYDRILISAASDKIPSHLYPQLNKNGILVCPVRNSIFQIKKLNEKDYKIKEFPGFVFVPLRKED